jgi:hypothetical protein
MKNTKSPDPRHLSWVASKSNGSAIPLGPQSSESGRVCGRCRKCSGLIVYSDDNKKTWRHYDGQLHRGHEVDFILDPSVAPDLPKKRRERTHQQLIQESVVENPHDVSEWTPILIRHVTTTGIVYSRGTQEFGPFTIHEEREISFDESLAAKFGNGVNAKDILDARLASIKEEITLEELNKILGVTVKRDEANKAITFLDMLDAQTNEDQSNVGFQAESGTGKSYIPLELLEYFPDSEKRTYAGASPTNFYHEVGQWRVLCELAREIDLRGVFDRKELDDDKRKVIVVDLANKNLVFLDQPHWSLLEKLRPLLSHDKKILRYSITDKTGKGGLRSKTVIIIGYCSVFFCTTKPTQEDQERTRLSLLSPESSQEKIREALYLLAKKIGDRKAFRDMIESDPMRCWLKERVKLIRTTGIREVVIPNPDVVLERFLVKRSHLAPRHTRDFPRLMSYIKGFALLNCFNRKKLAEDTIEADPRDIEAGFSLYELIATPNEMGISPETYRIYQEVISPLAQLSGDLGIPRTDIIKRYLEQYGRPLPWERLTKQILPALESAGLVRQDRNPEDKREMLVYTPLPSGISAPANNTGDNRGVPARGQSALDILVSNRREILLHLKGLHFPESDDYADHLARNGILPKEQAVSFIEDALTKGVMVRNSKTGKYDVLIRADDEVPDLLRVGADGGAK